jgi:hypothetical protein
MSDTFVGLNSITFGVTLVSRVANGTNDATRLTVIGLCDSGSVGIGNSY